MFLDLTMEISERTPLFPGDPPVEIGPAATIEREGWNELKLSFASHTGTHIDAPFHMLPGGKTLDEYPIGSFMGRARVFDVRGILHIGPEHIGELDGARIVLFHTAHSARAFTPAFFRDNPVLTPEAARYLVEQGVEIIGLDSFTPDNAPYAVHRLLFRHDVRIVENLVNLERIGQECLLYIAPLHLKNADGAPCRVFAEVPD